MRHHNANRKFGMVRKQRKALLNSLARSLVLHQKIETTEPKAKELKSFIEKIVTTGKKGTLSAKRSNITKIGPKAEKALSAIVEKNKDRKGGYVRVLKTQRRLSDGSKMAIIEFV